MPGTSGVVLSEALDRSMVLLIVAGSYCSLVWVAVLLPENCRIGFMFFVLFLYTHFSVMKKASSAAVLQNGKISCQ